MPSENQALKAVTIIIRSSNSLKEALKKEIETYGINTTEFGLLETLYHKGKQTMQAVSQKLLLANSSATYAADKLCQKQFIKRKTDENDRRIVYLELTPSGQTLIETLFPIHEAFVTRLFHDFDANELASTLTLLKTLGLKSETIIYEEGN